MERIQTKKIIDKILKFLIKHHEIGICISRSKPIENEETTIQTLKHNINGEIKL